MSSWVTPRNKDVCSDKFEDCELSKNVATIKILLDADNGVIDALKPMLAKVPDVVEKLRVGFALTT
jgi:hypothetical protein